MGDEPQICPRCGSDDIDAVIYGEPIYPLQQGTVAGGCLVTPDGPDCICRSCQHEWQVLTSFRARISAEHTGWPHP